MPGRMIETFSKYIDVNKVAATEVYEVVFGRDVKFQNSFLEYMNHSIIILIDNVLL